jgi:hypothetical protein
LKPVEIAGFTLSIQTDRPFYVVVIADALPTTRFTFRARPSGHQPDLYDAAHARVGRGWMRFRDLQEATKAPSLGPDRR